MQKNRDTLEIIQEIFQTTFALPKEVVTLDADLAEDLGLDSIDAIDLIILLEKESGCKLTMDNLLTIKTIGDVVNKVEEFLAQQGQ